MINSRIIRPAGGAELRAKQMRPGCVGGWTQSNRGISLENEDKKIYQAIPIQAVWDLKYKPGQKIEVTMDRVGDQLIKAPGVVLEDHRRYILIRVINKHKRAERMQILKVDIIRHHTAEKGSARGVLKVGLC